MPTLASLERPVSSTTAQQLQMWRASILDGVLRGTLLFAFIALLGALNTAFHSYQQEKDLTPNALGLFAGVVSIYLAAFALIALATFSRKFPYRFRAGLLLGVYYVLAVLNLSLSALSGDGRVLLFAVVALTALLFDLRFSLGALAFSLLTLAAFGWLEVSGQIVISAERQLNATSAASWISGSVVFLVLCVAVLLSANYLLRMLARTLAEARTTLAREQRLRGALRTLSDINQLIVRERDLQHLLSEACHILVRGREYAFAWISLLNEDGVTARLAAASDPQLADPAAFIFRTNGSATGPLCAPAALRARSPIHIEPGAHDPCPSCPLLTHYPQRSAVALPLLSNDRAFGTLEVVHSASSGIFDDEETNLLQEMADNIAFALDSLSIEAERQTQTRFVAVLNDITRATLSAPDFNAMLQTLADQIGELFSADVCHITLWDEARGLALPGAAYGLMREAFTAVQGRPGKVTLTEAVLRAERVIVADDIAHSEFARIAQTAIQDLVNSVLQEMPASPAAQAALSEPSPLVSGMALPLIADGQKLGAVLIGYTQPHHFSPAEVARAEQAAAQVALAMAKARLFSETQTTAAELSRLYAAAQDLSASLETPKILNHLARHFVEALNGTSSYINGFSPDGQMLTVLAEYWSKAAVPTERKSDLGASMPRQDYPTVMQAVNKGEAVTLQTGMPGLSLVEQAQFVDYGIQSMLFVPVVVGGHVIGDAEIWESRRARVFTPAEIHLAQTLATHAASAIENARLFEMLEQRGAYFRALVENSAEGVAILDAQGNFRYVAPAEERLSGYAPETLLGQSAFRFIHPADLPRLQAAFEGGLQTPGATMTLEYRLQRRDGAWRHFEVTGQNLLHDQHMAGIVLNYRDITERKQAEQALQEKQALLLEAQHIAHIGNWWHDLVTGEIYWSDEFFRIIGREPQKPTIELGLAIMHPEDLPVLQKAMEESAAGKVNHEHEFRFIRPDGEIGWIHNRWIAIYDDAGREIKRVGTHQDITERKRAEAALRESEERYRIVSEMTSDYAVAERIEPDGRSVPEWITESFTRITGYSVEEAARPDFMRRLIHPDDWPIILQQSARFLAGQTANIEARILTKTGEMRWMHEVIHPIWDETQGRVVRIYGSARDITERKRAEVALYEREKHSQALLRLSQNLERSQTYAEALKAALEEIRHIIGYQTLWAYLFTEDKQQAKLILGSGGCLH